MLLAVAQITACSPRHDAPDLARQREIQQATQHYSDLIVAMDHASIAAMYTNDGEMAAEGQPIIRGPDAIKAHLETFKDFHVLSESLTADTITVSDSAAHVVGTYHQKVRIPAGDVVEVSGGYVADWLLDKTGQWRVRRMATAPRLDTAAILASARPEIDAANAAWFPGMQRRDADAIAAAYADSGLFIAGDGAVTRGRAAVARMYAARFARLRPIRNGGVVQDGLTVVGPTRIVEWGHGWLELAPERDGQPPVRSEGSYLTVWQREADGHWRIVRNLAF